VLGIVGIGVETAFKHIAAACNFGERSGNKSAGAAFSNGYAAPRFTISVNNFCGQIDQRFR